MTGNDVESDDGDGYTLDYTYDEATPASIAVIQALCAIENIDPLNAPEELGFTLYDHVNPDALDTIVADGSGSGDVIVDLTLNDYDISISDTGRIRMRSRTLR